MKKQDKIKQTQQKPFCPAIRRDGEYDKKGVGMGAPFHRTQPWCDMGPVPPPKCKK